MTWLQKYRWGVVVALVLVVLIVSSSMTYAQQSLIPLLRRLLAGEPLRGVLAGVDFDYAGTRISIAALGYFHFVEFFLRKAAHVTVFALLGAGGCLSLRQAVRPTWLRAALTWLSCTGLAALDEFHQLLTGGRSPLFQDVMLDSVAAAVSIGLTLLIARKR